MKMKLFLVRLNRHTVNIAKMNNNGGKWVKNNGKCLNGNVLQLLHVSLFSRALVFSPDYIVRSFHILIPHKVCGCE